MKKEYYDENKANYIREKLSTTHIDQIYWPIITDVILRRQFEFKLDENRFIKDVDNFITNVDSIEIGRPKGIYDGLMDYTARKMYLSPKLFDDKKMKYPNNERRNEVIYDTFAHECTHAMNDHGNTDFLDRGIVEIFTACEANLLTVNKPERSNHFLEYTYGTYGYTNYTPYIDVIMNTFDIDKKELLNVARDENINLHAFLDNRINEHAEPEDLGMYSTDMSTSLTRILWAIQNKKNPHMKENFFNANKDFYSTFEKIINKRISDIDVNSIEEFKDKYDKILIAQTLSRAIIEGSFAKLVPHMEMRQAVYDEHELVSNKLFGINAILNSEEIENKLEILNQIKGLETYKDVNEFLRDNNIDKVGTPIELSEEKAEEYNANYISNGMEWDNSVLEKYIEDLKTKVPKMNVFQKAGSYIKETINRIKEFGTRLTNQRKQKMLPEPESHEVSDTSGKLPELEEDETEIKEVSLEETGVLPEQVEETEIENNNKSNSWDLSNWGISKEEVANKTAQKVKQLEQTQQSELGDNNVKIADENENSDDRLR